jgi:hypothetical protein
VWLSPFPTILNGFCCHLTPSHSSATSPVVPYISVPYLSLPESIYYLEHYISVS